MLLDSGSSQNILAVERMGNARNLRRIEGEQCKILTMSGTHMIAESASFSFALGGKQFDENFRINDSLPVIEGDVPFIGILGQTFMQQHRLVIDFTDFTFHSSDVTPENLSIADCEFFLPMELGLKYYNLPMLYMKQNGKEILAIADTGATNNVIASHTIEENNFSCQYIDGTTNIVGLSGSVEAKIAVVLFTLLTMNEDDVDPLECYDLFTVIPNYLITPTEGACDEDGNQLPPVGVIIGTPFMAKEGWTLDFGAKIIYKRKAA